MQENQPDKDRHTLCPDLQAQRIEPRRKEEAMRINVRRAGLKASSDVDASA